MSRVYPCLEKSRSVVKAGCACTPRPHHTTQPSARSSWGGVPAGRLWELRVRKPGWLPALCEVPHSDRCWVDNARVWIFKLVKVPLLPTTHICSSHILSCALCVLCNCSEKAAETRPPDSQPMCPECGPATSLEDSESFHKTSLSLQENFENPKETYRRKHKFTSFPILDNACWQLDVPICIVFIDS